MFRAGLLQGLARLLGLLLRVLDAVNPTPTLYGVRLEQFKCLHKRAWQGFRGVQSWVRTAGRACKRVRGAWQAMHCACAMRSRVSCCAFERVL